MTAAASKSGVTVTTVVVVTVVVGAGVVAAAVVGEGGGVGQGVQCGRKQKASDVARSMWPLGRCRKSRDKVLDLLFNNICHLNGSVVQWFVPCGSCAL